MFESRYRVGKTFISRTTPKDAKQKIVDWARKGSKGCVCIANVRSVTYSNQHEDYREVLNSSLMTTPDGMPLVWMARLWGMKDVQRTIGPDLFVQLLKDKESGLTHFLLGDTEETLDAIKKKYSDSSIVGTYSPPFCEVDEFDYPTIAKTVNDCCPDVIWVALRSPKQDYFAAKLLPYLEKGICVNVGAAFRFSIGGIKHPPTTLKKLGLTGFFWRKIDAKLLIWYIKSMLIICYWSIDIVLSRIFKKE